MTREEAVAVERSGRSAPPDCLECRLVGTGSMLALSGWFFYHARGLGTRARRPSPSHLYFNAALGVLFAGAGVARWMA